MDNLRLILSPLRYESGKAERMGIICCAAGNNQGARCWYLLFGQTVCYPPFGGAGGGGLPLQLGVCRTGLLHKRGTPRPYIF